MSIFLSFRRLKIYVLFEDVSLTSCEFLLPGMGCAYTVGELFPLK